MSYQEENGAVWKDDPRTRQLAMLLVECRDALPAISLASAKLRGIDLQLADRIKDALKPWEVAEGEDGI